MKKCVSLLAALMLVFSGLTLSAAAAVSQVYTFEEYSLSVAVPGQYYVFTQDMAPEDPLFHQFSITYEEEMEYLTKGGACNTILDITDTLNTFDLCVDVYPHDSPDLTTRSQEELEGLLESWMAVTYESYDELTIEASAVQTYHGVPYLTVAYTRETEEGIFRTADCFTIMNGFDYWFSLYSNLEDFSQPMKELLPRILSSASYDGTPGELAEVWAPLTLFPEEVSPDGQAHSPSEPASKPGLPPVFWGVLSGVLTAALVLLGAKLLRSRQQPKTPPAVFEQTVTPSEPDQAEHKQASPEQNEPEQASSEKPASPPTETPKLEQTKLTPSKGSQPKGKHPPAKKGSGKKKSQKKKKKHK